MSFAVQLRQAGRNFSTNSLFVLFAGMAVLLPIAFTPGVLLYFDVTPKAAVLLLGASIAMLCTGSSLRIYPPWNRGLRILSFLLCASALSLVLSTILSTHPAQSVFGTNWRRFGALVQVAIYILALLGALHFAATPNEVPRLFRVLALAGIPVAAYGVVQYFRIDPFLDSNIYVSKYLHVLIRPPSTLGHATYSAAYLCDVFFVCVGLRLMEKRTFWKVVGVCAAVLSLTAIVLGGTRSAVLALAAAAAYVLAYKRARPVWPRLLVIVGLLLGIGVPFYFSRFGDLLRSRFEQWGGDVSGGTRLYLWRDTASMSASRLFTGYGPETFPTEFGRFQSIAFARAFPNFYNESPHNILLDALVSQGIFGLFLLLSIIAVGIYCLTQERKLKSPLAWALTCMFIANLVTQQFMCFTIATAFYFFLNISLLVAISAAGPDDNIKAITFGPVTRIAVLVTAACFLIVAIRMVMTDLALARVKQDIEQRQVTTAISDYQRSRKWRLPGASSELWYSRAMADASGVAPLAGRALAWEEALTAARRAVDTAEDLHNAYYNLAVLSALNENRVEAEAGLRLAIHWAPHWFKPHWMLARILMLEGNPEAAEAEAVQARVLNGGKDPEVSETLRNVIHPQYGPKP